MKNLFVLFFMLVLVGQRTQATTDDKIKVVVFGSGIEGKNGEESIPEKELALTLRKIKELRPDAVFYTGSLIAKLEKENMIDIKAFRDNLNLFSKIVSANLGDSIPLYPLIGNHRALNARLINLFSTHFHIKKPPSLDFNVLSYIVKIDGAQFIVLASANYERSAPSIFKYWQIVPLLQWMEQKLAEDPLKINYRFVIGHEPAFSTTGVTGKYQGLDKNPAKRDQFWAILQKANAAAYFCSHESLFDRSHRKGVWQIISGGVKNADQEKDKGNFLSHFLLLTIPTKKGGEVIVEVLDLNGNVWDKFTISNDNQPIHQLRIL